MPLRFALLASCLAGICAWGSESVSAAEQEAAGAGARADAAPRPVPAPAPVPPSTPPPRRPMPPEVAAALRDARATEALATAGRVDEAIANYRKSVAEPPRGDVHGVRLTRGIHLGMLASVLIVLERSDDADRLLAEFIDAQPPALRERSAGWFLNLIDRRIYIASGRGRADAIVALLEQRAVLRPFDSPLACVDPPYLPVAVAPMHNDPQVLAALRGFGCDGDIIAQIDRLAEEPIPAALPLPAPGRRRVRGAPDSD